MDQPLDVDSILSRLNESDPRDILMLQMNASNQWFNVEVPQGPRPVFEAALAFVYSMIFIVGLLGNLLVCYVVIRNRHMRTVTNYFIANLGLADIMLCTLAGPVTATEYIVKTWTFGKFLCHLIPFTLGVSVYLSVFTLMMIACDRYFVIMYPFRPRMQESTCLCFIGASWAISFLLTLPYGVMMDVKIEEETGGRAYCYEAWPHELHRKWFTSSTAILQFIVPFIVTAFCYVRVSLRLRDRSKNKPGEKSFAKEELERKRKRRTNRMLVAMVIIFGASWLPLNMHHIFIDFNGDYAAWIHADTLFFVTHAFAMSSACYNPFLYAWLNENFRKEFKFVLPCCFSNGISVKTSFRDANGPTDIAEPTAVRVMNGSERSCQRPLLTNPQSTDLMESKVNGNRSETSYLTTNLITTCEV